MAWNPNPNNPAHYIGSTGFMFRELNDAEEEDFRQYAQDEPPTKNTLSIYHPVCREEWEKRGIK